MVWNRSFLIAMANRALSKIFNETANEIETEKQTHICATASASTNSTARLVLGGYELGFGFDCIHHRRSWSFLLAIVVCE